MQTFGARASAHLVFACAVVRGYTYRRWVARAGDFWLHDTRDAWDEDMRTGATIMHGGSRTGTPVIWVVGVVLSVAAAAVPAWTDDRAALVVGNATYEHAPALATPLNDAADVGAALQRLGFAVTRIDDADQGELRRGLHEFATVADAAETAVVFYAGHGLRYSGRNFLVPVDARLSTDQDIEFETVPLALVERAVGRASGVRLIILDASRESAFPASLQGGEATGSTAPGLAPIEPSAGTLVVFASKEGTEVLDGDGRNSIFSGALLRHLEEPSVAVGHMLSKVRNAVLSASGGTQEPSVYGSLSDRSAALGPKPASSAEAPARVTPSEGGAGDDQLTAELVAAERLFWESIKDSGDPAEFRAYLDRFPSGTYTALARIRLKRLGGAVETASPDVVSTSEAPTSAETGTETPAGLSERDAELEPEAMEEALGLQHYHRRLIQSGLALLGFDPGPVDGVFGQRTRAAISEWQGSVGKAATGYLDVEAAKTLSRKGTEAPSPGEQRERSAQEAMDILVQALQAAEGISDHEERAEVLIDIGDVLVSAGDVRRAMRVLDLAAAEAESIEGDLFGSLVHSELSRVQAEAGSVEAAFVTLQQIKSDSRRAPALAAVAEIQAETGDTHGAAQSIDRALSTAERMKDEEHNDEYHNNLRVEALTSIGEVQARVGDREGAEETIQRALVIAGRIGEDYWHVEALATVGETLATIGDAEGAEQTIERALAIAVRIDDDSLRVSTIARVGVTQAIIGDTEGAEKTIESALAIAERIADHFERASAFADVASAQLRIGEVGSAIQSIEGAISSADQLDADFIPFSIWWTLREIAGARAKAGDAQSAITYAGRIVDASTRRWAFVDIAQAQANAGDIKGALETAERITEASSRDIAVSSVAQAQALTGDIKGALETAERITEASSRERAVSSVAQAQAGLGDIQGALATVVSIAGSYPSANALVVIAKAQMENVAQ